jgi:hypothetical protein
MKSLSALTMCSRLTKHQLDSAFLGFHPKDAFWWVMFGPYGAVSTTFSARIFSTFVVSMAGNEIKSMKIQKSCFGNTALG